MWFSRTLWLAFLLCGAALAQTPTLVNHNSGSSTKTNALGTALTGCATDSYCAYVADPSLASNLLVAMVEWSNSPSATFTATTDQSQTMTATGPHGCNATAGRCAALFYLCAATTSTRKITFTSTAASTQVLGVVSQWMNVATSSCADGSGSINTGGTSSTTITSGSTAFGSSGDLIVFFACRIGTAAATSFTAGSGQSNITWGLQSADIADGCAVQTGVYNSTSTFTPQMTQSGATTFIALAQAFKAASAGTAGAAFRIVHVQHEALAADSATNNYQFPSSGNLLFLETTIGGNTQFTGVTDGSSNSWYPAGGAPYTGFSAQGFYAPNATTSATITVAVTAINNGGAANEANLIFFDIAGADTQPLDTYVTSQGNQGAVAGFTSDTIVPNNSNGLIFDYAAIASETIDACTNTGCTVDGIIFAGEPESGPEPVDQNDAWSHLYNSSTASQTFTYTKNVNSNGVGLWGSNAIAFRASGAALSGAKFVKLLNISKTGTSATTITTGSLPTSIGDLAVCLGWSLSSVGPSATPFTDSASNTWTQATGSPFTFAGEAIKISVAYSVLTTGSASNTFTFHLAGGSAFPTMQCFVATPTTGTPTFHTHTSGETSSASTSHVAASATITAGDLVIAGIGLNTADSGYDPAQPGGSYTTMFPDGSLSTYVASSSEFWLSASSGTQTDSFTTGSTHKSAEVLISFTPAALLSPPSLTLIGVGP